MSSCYIAHPYTYVVNSAVPNKTITIFSDKHDLFDPRFHPCILNYRQPEYARDESNVKQDS